MVAAGQVPAVTMRGISKRFPGVLANDQVDFEVLQGEIHTLLGENGAGKSTLSNILTGLYRPDDGEILLHGEPVAFHSPRDAIEAGIGMVHQHFRLAASFTVAENLVLGHRDAADRGLLLEPRVVEGRIADLAERYRMPVNPRARIWQLSVGEQQRVEILKALYRGASVLILDEPTSQLTPQEADDLFQTLRLMAGEQRAVIFISHKLEEVMAVSNRVTVLRRRAGGGGGAPGWSGLSGASPMCPMMEGGRGWLPRSPSRTPWSSRPIGDRQSRRAACCIHGGSRQTRKNSCSGSTSARPRRRRRRVSSPAATSRRSCSPGSSPAGHWSWWPTRRPAGWTSAPPTTCADSSWRRPNGVSASCSSAKTSTRSWRWRIVSLCSTTGASLASSSVNTPTWSSSAS